MTDRRLLRRAQWGTVGLGLAAGAVLLLVGRRDLAPGLAIGAVWSALNLRAMEGLLRAAVLPRDHARDLRMVFLWSTAKLTLYVLAVWLLIVAPFPVAGLALGLTVMLAALVLAGLLTRPRPSQEPPQRGDDAEA